MWVAGTTRALVLLAIVVVAGLEPSLRAASLLLPADPDSPGELGPPVRGQKRARTAVLNPTVLERQNSPLHRPAPRALRRPSSRLTLNLFSDAVFEAVVERTDYREARRYVARGVIDGVPGSLVLMAVNDEAVAASVLVPGRGVYTVEYAGFGAHRVAELDPESIPGCGPEVHAPAAPVRGRAAARGRGRAAEAGVAAAPAGAEAGEASPPQATPGTAGDNNVVDVMVVYTGAARLNGGGVSGMNSLIDLAIEEANTCYANSEINVRLNLVYRGELSYVETANANTDLSRLATAGDGQLDGVHALRNQYGADVVCLLTETMASYAGLGYVMSPASSSFASYAFSVVKREYAVGQFVFAHEVGHNMGCMHDRQNSTSAGASSYSYGYRFYAGGTQYRTVMAYAPGVRIPYFSNPSVSYLGSATGVASGATSADNARSINETAPVVANFRGTVTQIGLTESAYTRSETNESVTFSVVRSGGMTNTVTVQFSTVDGTAVAGLDYVATNGTLVFGPGETNLTVEVELVRDERHENTEAFQFRLTNPIGAALSTATATVTVSDDDRSTVAFGTTSRSLYESNATATVEVVRTGSTHTEVSVRYATVGGTAAAGADFTAASGVLTFGAEETAKSITVALNDDRLSESNEVFYLRLSNPTNTTLGVATNVTLTIRASDGSLLNLTTSRVYVAENAGAATVTVRRSGTTNTLVSVNYATADNSATNELDYTEVEGRLVFEPGEIVKTVSIPVENDELQTRNRSFHFRLSEPSDARIGLGTNLVVITEDDTSYVGFSASTTVARETNEAVTLTVTRTGRVETEARLGYATVAGTATAEADFEAASGTLEFGAGETSKTLTIGLVDDGRRELPERFQVILSGAVNTTITNATNTVVIYDNDGSWVGFAAAGRTVYESNGVVAVTISRTGAVQTAVSVRYATVAGTALAGSDFVSASGTVFFAEGETNKSVEITVNDDRIAELAEAFYVRLSSPSNTVLTAATNFTVNLRTSDASVLSLTTNRVYVSEGAGSVVLTIRRTGATNNVVTVNYATANNTASSEADYEAESGTLSFESGVTARTVSIAVVNDDRLTRDRSFYFRLSEPRDATLALGTNVVVITENDVSRVGFSGVSRAVYESAGTFTAAVWRTGATNTEVTVRYATANGSAVAGSDYTAASGEVAFAPGETNKTIELTVLADALVETNQTFFVRLSAPTNTSLGTYSNLTVTIQNGSAGNLAAARSAAGVAAGGGTGVVEIKGLTFSADGRLHLRVEGPLGTPFRLEATTNLIDWRPASNEVLVLTDGSFEWIETPDRSVPQRYFRVVPP